MHKERIKKCKGGWKHCHNQRHIFDCFSSIIVPGLSTLQVPSNKSIDIYNLSKANVKLSYFRLRPILAVTKFPENADVSCISGPIFLRNVMPREYNLDYLPNSISYVAKCHALIKTLSIFMPWWQRNIYIYIYNAAIIWTELGPKLYSIKSFSLV
jgi:hypothetical protein